MPNPFVFGASEGFTLSDHVKKLIMHSLVMDWPANCYKCSFYILSLLKTLLASLQSKYCFTIILQCFGPKYRLYILVWWLWYVIYLWKCISYHSNFFCLLSFLLIAMIIFSHFSNWSGRVKRLILKLIPVIGWLLDSLKQLIVLFRHLYQERRGREANPLGWQRATDLELRPQAQILVNIIFQTLYNKFIYFYFL